MSASDSGVDEIAENLRACRQDQARVTIYFNGSAVSGVVAGVDAGTAEVREGGQRVVIRLDRIDAVRRD